MRPVLIALILASCTRPEPVQQPRPKLYWFIPDGLRAEPDLFKVFEWARAGELPNIKKMMDQGAWGYSIPDFPSHTPTNFASLLTGAHPVVHGIADGPMHTEGNPLAKPSVAGFASVAKKAPPIWRVMEEAGLKVALLSIPGSTPPELDRGITVRGRWAPWGFDTPAINYEPESMKEQRKSAGRGHRLFFLGPKLTDFVPYKDGKATLTAYGASVPIEVQSSEVRFTVEKNTFQLKPGAWSDWHPITLRFGDQPVASQVRARVIKLWPDGRFRIRLFFNNANRFNTVPGEIVEPMTSAVGPMVDFPDNWPAQLTVEPEDEATFKDEAMDCLAWHRRAAGWMLRVQKPDVLIQDTYTPNQMLEARWWLRWVEPAHPDHDPKRAEAAWRDLKELYKGVDAVIGEALAAGDPNTVFVLSSDHGIIPLVKQVYVNNLFAKRGWLTFTIDKETNEPAIDWQKTRAVYLKMNHVYVHPDGLGGNWKRGSGPAYEKLRDEVAAALAGLDDSGKKPLVRTVKWEQAGETLGLPPDRVGDLVLEAVPGYQWFEELTADGELFGDAKNSGYKQAIDPRTTKGVWAPFVIMGPGVKKGVALTQPIQHADQMPTILRLLHIAAPPTVQGRVLAEIIE
jgi:predicted AlkP superfamily phosphohydrolase/phosphomutase